MASPDRQKPSSAKAGGLLSEAGSGAGSSATAPDPNLINLKLLAAYDQLPEPHVPKAAGAIRLGLFAVVPGLLWLMVFGLLRAI